MQLYLYKNIFIRNFYRYVFIVYLITRNLWATNLLSYYIFAAFIFYCVGSTYIFASFFSLIYFFFESLIRNAGGENELNYFIFDSASNLFFIILFLCSTVLLLLLLWNIVNILYLVKQRIHYFSFISRRKFFFQSLFVFIGFITVVTIIKYLLIPLYIWYFFYFKNDYYNSIISFYPEISFVLFFQEIKEITFVIFIFCFIFFIMFYKANNENLYKFLNLFMLHKSIFYTVLLIYLLFVCPPHLFYVLFLFILFTVFDFIVINYIWISKKKIFF